jgi:hypothetical protein
MVSATDPYGHILSFLVRPKSVLQSEKGKVIKLKEMVWNYLFSMLM